MTDVDEDDDLDLQNSPGNLEVAEGDLSGKKTLSSHHQPPPTYFNNPTIPYNSFEGQYCKKGQERLLLRSWAWSEWTSMGWEGGAAFTVQREVRWQYQGKECQGIRKLCLGGSNQFCKDLH